MAAVLTYLQNGEGRSGHRLKDLFSSVTIGVALDAEVLFNSTWKEQSILPVKHLRKEFCRNREFNRAIGYECRRNYWGGLPFDEFERLRDIVNIATDEERDTLIQLSGVLRLHLAQLYKWEAAGRVKQGSFAKALAILRKLFWGEVRKQEARKVEKVAIHVRRGDIMRPNFERGNSAFGSTFYQGLIDGLNSEFPAAAIKVFTQLSRSEDLDALHGAEVVRGGERDARRDFLEMAQADLFIPSNSSFSYWLSYLNLSSVRVYGPIAHFDPGIPIGDVRYLGD